MTTDTPPGIRPRRRRGLLVAGLAAVILAVTWWANAGADRGGLTGDTCFGMVADDTIVEVLGAPAGDYGWELREWGARVGGWCSVDAAGQRLSVEVGDLPSLELRELRAEPARQLEFDAYPDWDVQWHGRVNELGTVAISAYRRVDGELPANPSHASVFADLDDRADEQAALTRVLEELLDYYETWVDPDERLDAAPAPR